MGWSGWFANGWMALCIAFLVMLAILVWAWLRLYARERDKDRRNEGGPR